MPEGTEFDNHMALPALQPLAKKTAHNSLRQRLLEEGLGEGAALTVARAVVDPADARRRLDRLIPVRVPGGRFLALDTHVWGAAATPFVVNNRAASSRRYPAGGLRRGDEASRFRPLRPATSPADDDARLELQAKSPEHLIWSAERSTQYLLDNNNLAASIGAQGVMVAITAAVVTCRFTDESPPVTMLSAVDGSSRVTGVHEVLGLTPREVLFDLPNDDRAFRGQIADLLALLGRSDEEVAEEQVAQLRALQIPARILLEFEPDEIAPVSFAKAVDSLVHLVHVEPPKQWDEAASLDAKADSVVDSLQAAHIVTRRRKDYLDGMLTPAEASKQNWPSEADQRAIEILGTISKESPRVKRAVRAGVLEISHAQKQVRKEEKARIAVELALRAIRADFPAAMIKSARLALQNAYLMPGLWGRGVVAVAGETPEELRDAALKELADGVAGPARMRLAGQGAFWLAAYRALREAHFFNTDRDQRDGRSPARILELLAGSEHGINALYRAIVDGRDGQAPVQVNEQGRRLRNVHNKPIQMSSDWVRQTVVPARGQMSRTGDGSASDLPTRMLLDRTAKVISAVDSLEDAHSALREVKDASGRSLIDEDGLNAERAEELRDRLERLRTQLAMYGMTWTRKHEAEVENPLDPADEEPAEDSIVGGNRGRGA